MKLFFFIYSKKIFDIIQGTIPIIYNLLSSKRSISHIRAFKWIIISVEKVNFYSLTYLVHNIYLFHSIYYCRNISITTSVVKDKLIYNGSQVLCSTFVCICLVVDSSCEIQFSLIFYTFLLKQTHILDYILKYSKINTFSFEISLYLKKCIVTKYFH